MRRERGFLGSSRVQGSPRSTGIPASTVSMSAFPPLSKQEVVALLDSVPVFHIVNEDGRIVGTSDENGDEAVRWWADVDEANSALVVAQLKSPEMPLRLSVTPLGTAFALSEKWQETPSKLPLKLHASRAVVAGVADELGATADADAFPIFSCEELSNSRIMPFFLSRQDLLDTWVAAGRPAEAVPKELTVTLLRTLAKLMLERPLESAGSSTTGAGTAMNWRTSMFIASSKATKKAHELQEADNAIRQKKEEKDAEPPPLE